MNVFGVLGPALGCPNRPAGFKIPELSSSQGRLKIRGGLGLQQGLGRGFGGGGAGICWEGTCRLRSHPECKGQGHPWKNGFILNVSSVTVETLRETVGPWMLGHKGSSHLAQLPRPAEEQTERTHRFLWVIFFSGIFFSPMPHNTAVSSETTGARGTLPHF